MAVSNGLNRRSQHGATTLSPIETCTFNAVEAQAVNVPSNAGGAQIVTGGFTDFTVSATGFQRVPVVYPGDSATLTWNNGASEFTGAAVCKSLQIVCDIGGSTNIAVTY